jgi:hypothetical protein
MKAKDGINPISDGDMEKIEDRTNARRIRSERGANARRIRSERGLVFLRPNKRCTRHGYCGDAGGVDAGH